MNLQSIYEGNYMEEKKKASEAHMRATAKWEKESIRE